MMIGTVRIMSAMVAGLDFNVTNDVVAGLDFTVTAEDIATPDSFRFYFEPIMDELYNQLSKAPAAGRSQSGRKD